MSQNFLSNTSFHLLLVAIDRELADGLLQKGCRYCNHKLHLANYPRSPVGVLSQFRHFYNERISFCCVNCRKRTTPASVRFFGRCWYVAPILIFISALMLGINEHRLKQVKKHFGIVVSESTWKRWRRWWRDSFVMTPFWQHAKGFALNAIETKQMFPRALFVLFHGRLEEKLCLLLRFLSPLTRGGCAI